MVAASAPVIFTTTLNDLPDNPMFHNAIWLPADVAEIFRQAKGAVRVLCAINDGAEFPCALNPRADDYIIIVSKELMRRHKLKPRLPFRVSLRLDPDNGLLMPEELLEVLDQDEWGNQLFENLLPGRKRSYLYYIRSAKSIDTRIKRSFEIVEKLKLERK